MKKTKYGVIIGAAFAISGCNKSTLPDHYSVIPASTSNVKFLMLSPDVPMVNFFASTVKKSAVTPTATNAVQGMIFPGLFPNTTGYSVIPSGSVIIDMKVIDSSLVMPGAIVLSSTQNFDAGKFYTFAVADSMSKITSVLIEDDPSVADPTKSYFRLGNFVSNSASVKIEIIKTSTGFPYSKIYPNVAFKSVSAFDTLSAAGAVYKIYLKNPVTDAKLDSISAFTPSATKKYTIYTRGVMGLPVSNAKRPIITNYTNF